MFSTPLICSSIGAITVVATTSALAPGYWPETLMIGGTISGYCAIGRRMNDTPPRMMNTIDSTEAKIGRSMKKREIFIAQSRRLDGTVTSGTLRLLAGPASIILVSHQWRATSDRLQFSTLPVRPCPFPNALHQMGKNST